MTGGHGPWARFASSSCVENRGLNKNLAEFEDLIEAPKTPQNAKCSATRQLAPQVALRF